MKVFLPKCDEAPNPTRILSRPSVRPLSLVISTWVGLALTFSAGAIQYDLVTYTYEFVGLTGDVASGSAPVSQTDFNVGQGPNYGAGDRSNSPFNFGFHTTTGDVFYVDYFGFDFILSEDRNYLYANGSMAQLAFGGGFISASFITGADGVISWSGQYQAGGQTYTASGTGHWLREGFTPATVKVPEGRSTLTLLTLSALLVWWWQRALRSRTIPSVTHESPAIQSAVR